MNSRRCSCSAIFFVLAFILNRAGLAKDKGIVQPYPPSLPDKQAFASDRSPDFLKSAGQLNEGVEIAKEAPSVDFMYYPGQDYAGKPWSVWGDGCVANGKYYSAIGDHFSPKGSARVYEYDPASKKLRMLVNVREFLEKSGTLPPEMDYIPAKIHARLALGRDGWIYFATHRGSARTTDDAHGYKGDWILRTHPESGKTEIVAAQPVAKHCIPAGFLDPQRMIFYGGTAPGKDAPEQGVQFLAYDASARKVLKCAPDGFQRCAIFSSSTGRLYWDGKKYDPATNEISASAAPSVRSATAETPDGIVYGTTERDCDIWAFNVKSETLAQLGPGAVGKQTYTTSMDADAAGRYLYYIPGAHGGAEKDGTPVVQYDVKLKKRKVIAFLHPFYFEKYGYTPAGTFSSALDADGATLYVTWNGMRKGSTAWDCCALTAIHIPESERAK